VNPFYPADPFGQLRGDVFEEMKVKNFFKAKEIYEETKSNYTKAEQEFIEASLDNAFNQIRLYNEKITKLLSQKFTLPDTVKLKLNFDQMFIKFE